MSTKIDWDAQPFGKTPDPEIAKSLNVSITTVRKERTKRGIPPVKSRAWRSSLGIDWDQQPLGTVPDSVLATRLGVSIHSVYKQRRKRGLPNSAMRKKTTRRSRPHAINWDGVPLGERPDFVLAKRLQVPKHVVNYARRQRGIELTAAAHQEIREYQTIVSRTQENDGK